MIKHYIKNSFTEKLCRKWGLNLYLICAKSTKGPNQITNYMMDKIFCTALLKFAKNIFESFSLNPVLWYWHYYEKQIGLELVTNIPFFSIIQFTQDMKTNKPKLKT